jgi:hypothetical protein
MVQGLFRGRIARRIVDEWRRKRREKAARFIQRVGRGYLGRRRSRSINSRAQIYLKKLADTYKMYTQARENHKTFHPMESTDIEQLGDWEVYTMALSNLILEKPQMALDLCTQLSFRSPTFTFGVSLLKVILLYTWVCEGKARLQREDYLEEAIGIALHEQKMFRNKEEKVLHDLKERERLALEAQKKQLEELKMLKKLQQRQQGWGGQGQQEEEDLEWEEYENGEVQVQEYVEGEKDGGNEMNLEGDIVSIVSSLESLHAVNKDNNKMEEEDEEDELNELNEVNEEPDLLHLWEALKIIPIGLKSAESISYYVDPVSRFRMFSDTDTDITIDDGADAAPKNIPKLRVKGSDKCSGEVFNEIEYFYFQYLYFNFLICYH